MTEFEDIIIKPLISSDTIKFYNFHPSIQFTIDDFDDNNIHFLDIQIHSSGTSVYRKPTHTGQYQHISSFHLGHEKMLGYELLSTMLTKFAVRKHS